jgi:hypothetical protein
MRIGRLIRIPICLNGEEAGKTERIPAGEPQLSLTRQRNTTIAIYGGSFRHTSLSEMTTNCISLARGRVHAFHATSESPSTSARIEQFLRTDANQFDRP